MEEFYNFSTFLADLEKVERLGVGKVEGILAIARGGLTFAHFLAEKLQVRAVYGIPISTYFNRQKVTSPVLSSLPDLSHFSSILVVDDIADTGETLELVVKTLTTSYPLLKITTFTLFWKPTSQFKPDFYFHTTTRWVHFFWERE